MIPLYIKFQKKKLIYIDSDICNEDYSKEKRWTVKKNLKFQTMAIFTIYGYGDNFIGV